MKITAILAAVSLTAMASASAAIVDFEDFGALNGDLAPVMAGSFAAQGISFTSNDGIRVIKVGGTTNGFVPNDTPNPADAFGDYFLGTAFNDNVTDLTITYTTPVDGFSFDLGDIDGDEVFTINIFGVSNGLLRTDVISAGDPGTGDASVFTYGASNLGEQIARIEIAGVRTRNNVGIAFDNFNTEFDSTAVPVPAALPLFGAVIAGFGAMRRRKRG